MKLTGIGDDAASQAAQEGYHGVKGVRVAI